MRKLILSIFVCTLCVVMYGQTDTETTSRTTVYEKFMPAIITLNNGKTVNEKYANIFLKNGALLYKYGSTTKQADMRVVRSVEFSDCKYYCIDTLLAYVVGEENHSKLLCARLIDMEAYIAQLKNNRQITNLEIRSQLNVTSMVLSEDEESQYPLVDYFFYELNGELIKVNERNVYAKINKDKRRIFKTIIQQTDFDWTDEKSLMRLLKAVL